MVPKFWFICLCYFSSKRLLYCNAKRNIANTNKSELWNRSLIEYKQNTLIVWTKMANFEEQGIKFVNITFSKVVLITCHQTRQITFWRRKCGNGILFPKLFWPSVRKTFTYLSWSNLCHRFLLMNALKSKIYIWCLTISKWIPKFEGIGIIQRVYLLSVWIKSRIWLFRECINPKTSPMFSLCTI